MKQKIRLIVVVLVLVMMLGNCGLVRADIFNLGDGLTSLEFVPVGNAGNTPDNTGYGTVNYRYNMGKFEVTAGQYTEFLNKVAVFDSYGLYNPLMWTDSTYGCKIQRSNTPGSYVYTVAADYANRPVNYISWGDAARFANWLTNGQPTGSQGQTTTENGSYALNGAISDSALRSIIRKTPEQGGRYYIPSEDEWYKAAYNRADDPLGTSQDYWDYPTGTNAMPSNFLANPDQGNNANYYNYGLSIGSPYYRTVVGDFENSESSWGTFDQGGNVWEWTEAIVQGQRLIRGGGFYGSDSNSYYYQLRADYRYAYLGASTEYFYYGFRVSQVPEPATICMLAIGSLAFIRRKK